MPMPAVLGGCKRAFIEKHAVFKGYGGGESGASGLCVSWGPPFHAFLLQAGLDPAWQGPDYGKLLMWEHSLQREEPWEPQDPST